MAANPNTLTADFPKYWSKRMQVKRGKTTIYKEIVSFEEQAGLKKGTIVSRPYRSDLVINDMGADGSYQRQTLTDTEETLTINKEKEVTVYIKELDEIQSNYATANFYADDAAKRSDEYIDGEILAEYSNATSVVGLYDIGGGGSAADGIGFTLATSNITSVFSRANKKLDRQKVSRLNRWAVISPEFYEVLWDYIQGKESMLGDKVGQNPNEIGQWAGFRLFVSNSTGWSGRLELGTTPTNNDTVVINGVTFTFKTSVGSTAGNVLINGATGSVTNLVALINTPGTTTANGVALTTANQNLMKGIVATDSSTYLTIKANNLGYVVVSETLTAAADIWTLTKQIQHNLFGQGKPVDLVIQKYPSLRIKDRDGYIGKDYVTWFVLGLKSFVEGCQAMVDIQIRSDAF